MAYKNDFKTEDWRAIFTKKFFKNSAAKITHEPYSSKILRAKIFVKGHMSTNIIAMLYGRNVIFKKVMKLIITKIINMPFHENFYPQNFFGATYNTHTVWALIFEELNFHVFREFGKTAKFMHHENFL